MPDIILSELRHCQGIADMTYVSHKCQTVIGPG